MDISELGLPLRLKAEIVFMIQANAVLFRNLSIFILLASFEARYTTCFLLDDAKLQCDSLSF